MDFDRELRLVESEISFVPAAGNHDPDNGTGSSEMTPACVAPSAGAGHARSEPCNRYQ